MNGNLILDIHLIEFVDAADAMISEHECSGLYAEVTGLWILDHTGR